MAGILDRVSRHFSGCHQDQRDKGSDRTDSRSNPEDCGKEP